MSQTSRASAARACATSDGRSPWSASAKAALHAQPRRRVGLERQPGGGEAGAPCAAGRWPPRCGPRAARPRPRLWPASRGTSGRSSPGPPARAAPMRSYASIQAAMRGCTRRGSAAAPRSATTSSAAPSAGASTTGVTPSSSARSTAARQLRLDLRARRQLARERRQRRVDAQRLGRAHLRRLGEAPRRRVERPAVGQRRARAPSAAVPSSST